MAVTHRIGAVSFDLSFQAGFGYGYADTITWTDIEEDINGFSTRRGRKREIDRVTAGKLTAELNNRAGDYSPTYASGPHFGDIKPMVPIRVRVTRNAVTYPVIVAYADEWTPNYSAQSPNDARVQLSATDAFKILAIAQSASSVWEAAVDDDDPIGWWRFQDAPTATWREAQSASDGQYTAPAVRATGLIPYVPGDAVAIAGYWAQYNDSGVVPSALPFAIEVWLQVDTGETSGYQTIARSDDGTATHDWELNTLYSTNGNSISFGFRYGVNNYIDTTGALMSRGAAHHIAISVPASGDPTVHLNGVLVSSGMLDPPISYTARELNSTQVGKTHGPGSTNPWIGIIDELVVYDVEIDGAARYAAGVSPWSGDAAGVRIGRYLDVAAWPAGLRDLDAGIVELGPVVLNSRSVLDLILETADGDIGFVYAARDGDITFAQRGWQWVDTTATTSQVTFGASGIPYGDVTFESPENLLTNIANVTGSDGATATARDATSIGEYGPRPREIRVPSLNKTSAQGLADWTVLTGKDPQTRITSLKVHTCRTTATFDAVMALELGHRVTVELDTVGGETIDVDVLVEGIDHDVSVPAGRWTTTLWCSPVPPVDVFVIGSSAVGGPDILGY